MKGEKNMFDTINQNLTEYGMQLMNNLPGFAVDGMQMVNRTQDLTNEGMQLFHGTLDHTLFGPQHELHNRRQYDRLVYEFPRYDFEYTKPSRFNGGSCPWYSKKY
jgi:hypothetical protein